MPQIAYTDNVRQQKVFETGDTLFKNEVHISPSQAGLLRRNNTYDALLVMNIFSNVRVAILETKEINTICDRILKIASGLNKKSYMLALISK